MISMSLTSTLYIVEDDAVVRDSLVQLATSANISTESFSSADEFMLHYLPNQSGCLVLDMQLPGTNGLTLQKKLMETNCHLPIIFLTGFADVPLSVEAMKQGAFEFLEKPCNGVELLRVVQSAFLKSQEVLKDKAEKDKAKTLYKTLTADEQKVLDLLIAGRTNQEISEANKSSLRTIQFRRSSIFKKLNVGSKSELFDLFGTSIDPDFSDADESSMR
ncbi:MAG: DNA-binding response regulator [Blastopirellula sp.]|nr:MAG: DNA-binding response regulator [Blastopirellula sp.]